MDSVSVRDALLDPNSATADEHKRQLQESYRTADHAGSGAVPVLDAPAEAERRSRHHRDVRHLAGRGETDRLKTLSGRELFELVAERHSNKEIADILSIGPTTVETHRARILQNLDLHNTAELVLHAVRRGVVS